MNKDTYQEIYKLARRCDEIDITLECQERKLNRVKDYVTHLHYIITPTPGSTPGSSDPINNKYKIEMLEMKVEALTRKINYFNDSQGYFYLICIFAGLAAICNLVGEVVKYFTS